MVEFIPLYFFNTIFISSTVVIQFQFQSICNMLAPSFIIKFFAYFMCCSVSGFLSHSIRAFCSIYIINWMNEFCSTILASFIVILRRKMFCSWRKIKLNWPTSVSVRSYWTALSSNWIRSAVLHHTLHLNVINFHPIMQFRFVSNIFYWHFSCLSAWVCLCSIQRWSLHWRSGWCMGIGCAAILYGRWEYAVSCANRSVASDSRFEREFLSSSHAEFTMPPINS